MKKIVNDLLSLSKNNDVYEIDKTIYEVIIDDKNLLRINYKTLEYENGNRLDEKHLKLIENELNKLLPKDPMLRKKIYERRCLYNFMKYKSILNYKVIDSESPDFIIYKKDNKKIGIEITELPNVESNKISQIINNEVKVRDKSKFLGKNVKQKEHGYLVSQCLSDEFYKVLDLVNKKVNNIKYNEECSKIVIVVHINNFLIDINDPMYIDLMKKIKRIKK